MHLSLRPRRTPPSISTMLPMRAKRAAKPNKSYPSAKKGKRRLEERLSRRITKRIAKGLRRRRVPRNVPYVPPDQQKDSKLQHNRRPPWCTSLPALAQMTEKQLIYHLRAVKFLRAWKLCPHCSRGSVTKLRYVKGRGGVQRCSNKRCKLFILPHARHPVFTTASGQNYVPLKAQALILFCRVAGLTPTQTVRIAGVGRNVVHSIGGKWLAAVTKYVLKAQRRTKLGGRPSYTQCEVDEVTLRGRRTKCGRRITWYQYCGLITRGDRRSLVLEKMKVKSTWLKRHGEGKGQPASPRPISKKEWLPIAKRWVQMRRILLHCDGARSYRFGKVPGVLTTHVKHKRPNPIYAARKLMYLSHDQRLVHKRYAAKTPSERKAVDKVWVKTGTQIIDNIWRQAKTKGIPKEMNTVSEHTLDSYVRELQWRHWNAEEDKWQCMGNVLADSMCP